MRTCAVLLVLLATACGDDEGLPDGAPTQVDAALSECGLPLPGSRCAGATKLERCDGKAVQAVDCPALCGPNPEGSGFACVAKGDACGPIDVYGACAGTVLVYCSNRSAALEVVDCAGLQATCGYINTKIGYGCATECTQAGVFAEGQCEGPALVRRCRFDAAGYHVTRETCPTGTTCQEIFDTAGVACVANGNCSTLGPEGRCAGTHLQRCEGGTIKDTDCGLADMACTYGGMGIGYACVGADDMGMGAFHVSGTVRYEDRVPSEEGLGPRTETAARGVSIAVVDEATMSVVAEAITADDGSYAVAFEAVGNVHVVAATLGRTKTRPIRVLRSDGLVHGFGSTTFAKANDETMDLLITETSGEAAAFNIFDSLVTGLDAMQTRFHRDAPPRLTAVWAPAASEGTYFSPDLHTIYLVGDPTDDDGYDDAVILHELGHFVEDVYARSDSPGGVHDGSPTDPRLAWSEGFATYFSSVVRGDARYIDTNAAGAWALDAETGLTPAQSGSPNDDISEDTVTELLWDVGDAPEPDDDPLAAGQDEVLGVCWDYFRGTDFANDVADRGVRGVDLVDWFDGWFMEKDLTACAEMRELAMTYSFPYDFAGPAGACP